MEKSTTVSVKTTQQNQNLRGEWTEEAQKNRKWGASGKIIGHSDSHGLCYKVLHEDGTEGYYDPSELELEIL